MTRILSSLISLLIIFLACALPASAQYPATGTPASGSFGGGPDVINLGNLNAHLDIPIIRKPGRGGDNFSYDLTYDSSVWVPTTFNGTTSWQLFLNNSTVLGWQGFNGAEPGGIVYTVTITYSSPHSPCSVTEYFYSNFSYWDNTGTQHPFPYSLQGTWIIGSGQGGCPPTGPMPAAPWSGTTTDGSGYTMSVTPSAGTPPVLSATLLDKNGKKIGAPVTQQPPPPFIGGQDRNGNLVTTNSGTVTDTLGTTALTLFGVAPSNTTLSYTAPSGATASYTVKYTSYTVQTNFGCSGISEYGPTSNNLVSEIDLPDGSKYSFAYEATPGHTSNVTGRVKQITLPTGGTISYTYTSGNLTGSVVGSNDPIVCADGTTAGLQRSTPDTGSNYWNYARTQVSGKHWQTTITDPTSNQTVIDFQQDSGTYTAYNFFETQRKTYQGSTSGTLLQTLTTCYNGTTSNCPTTAVSSPFTQKTVYTQWPSGLESENNFLFNSYGLTTEEDDYDYGSGSPGGLLRKALTTYASLGNGIVSMPASIVVENASGATVAKQTFTYDQGTPTATSGTPQHNSISGSRGNVTTANYYTNTSAYLTKTFTYFDTGNVQTATDVNLGVTTYTYSSASCGNSFPTGVTEAITTLTQSMTWNCTGGVQLTATDENNQTTTTTYIDADFWRPAYVTDPLGNSNTYYYQPNASYSSYAVVSSMTFNGGNSIASDYKYLDGLGRTYVDQRIQSPTASLLDSVSYTFDANGRPYSSSVPCVIAWAGTCSTPKTTQTYDALNRPLVTADGGTGTTTYTYTQNDVLVAVGPAPSGEHTKSRQLEYDALGRLTSVCELTALPGSGTCGQTTTQTGYWTKYTYDALGDLLTVTQNAQAASGSQQTRTYAYDAMSRLTSETNPESGTTSYGYDSVSGTVCASSSPGNLIKRTDANGNYTCFNYDALHRLTDVGNNNPSASNPGKRFRYDNTSGYPGSTKPTGISNTLGRLAEAATDAGGTGDPILTDEWFSYTVRGEVSDVYELTPHSSPTYYHVSQTYWANGGPNVLAATNNISLPTITYGAEGEGRPSTVSAFGQNPVSAINYDNLYQSPYQLSVTFGSGDSDVFTYDPNTFRLNKYQFRIGTQTVTGTLGWNANWSLGSLGISDPFSTANTQSCSFAADDLSRISQVNCGTIWGQNFTYDPFGNIQKNAIAGTGGSTFTPTYQSSPTTNRVSSVGGVSATYDANGNSLNDTFRTSTWNVFSNPITIGSVSLTYDAFDRMVEQSVSGTNSEIVYSPAGVKLALMSGTSLTKAFVPLPGGDTAVYTSSGLAYYRHTDHLGSSRFASTPTQTLYADLAYSPFGEPYASSGAIDPSFTGQNQDTTAGLYDFLYREHDPNQSRWTSPDPGGLASVNPAYPQSWNRYAYVQNSPLALTDPQGLDCIYGGSYVNGAVGEYQADSGVYIVPGDNCVSDDDNGLYVDGTVTSTQLDSSGNLTYAWIGSDADGNPAIFQDSAGDFANWDWSQADPSVQANILAISQVLAPLNKLSDCTGQAIANEVPLVGKKLFGAPNPDPIGNKARSLSKALSPNPSAKLLGVVPFNYATNTQRLITGLDKLDLPVLSEGAANIAAKFSPYASALSKFLGVAGPAFMAGNAAHNTYACYNKP
jgi:RHS repeat-associated protein